jgi:multicomponent Na+:H+ antiporter subunit E
MLRAASLGIVLFLTWILLSGFFEPLLLAFGVLSCAIVVFIAHRMDVIDHEGHPIHLGPKSPAYWLWLGWQIVLANLDVARRILTPALPIAPTVIKVKASQNSELGQVIYANSITLTPGTVSLMVEEDGIIVHALSLEAAAELAAGDMDRRVTGMEGMS